MALFSLPETAQEVFDIVAKHLLTQNAVSREIGGPCLYRSSNGQKCAAGCLIPDDKYSAYFEGSNWCDLVNHHSFPDNHLNLISSLQSIHDRHETSKWKKELKSLADDYELDSGVLENF